jgi:hypothetical protein
VKKLLIICILLFSKNAFSNDFSFIFDWSNLKNCTSGNPNTVTNPIFYINDIPKGTKEIIFKLKDLDVPGFNHGGGKVSISNLKIVLPEDQKFGEYLFKIEPGNFKYKSPCPPDGQHTYSWIAIANKIEANSNQKYPAVLKANKNNAASSQSEDLKKLQELFDSGVLTEEQFNAAKSKLNTEMENNDLKKLQELFDSGVLTEEQFNAAKLKLGQSTEKAIDANEEVTEIVELFGIPLGGVIDIGNQTIGGKKFEFLTRSQANNKFDVRSDPNWNTSKNQPGKHAFEGKKGKNFEGTSMVMLKNPDKKYKMKAYYIIFANFDGVDKVVKIDVSPWGQGNKVVCKKRATELYMEHYNSGKYQITEEEHADNKKFPDKIIENDNFLIYVGCYGDQREWLWVGAEDKKLKELNLAN